MKETLQIIHEMWSDGVIGPYAIGGAVGATFYLEPSATLDIDVFVTFQQPAGTALLALSPIYEHLAGKGCHAEGEHVLIAGWPVQFLPPGSPLEAEAIAEAVETTVAGIPARVMTAEHLLAIALKTGRAKDHSRISQFLESGVIDQSRLDQILARHGLVENWRRFKDKYTV